MLSASTNIRREIKDMMRGGGGKREEKAYERIRDRKRDRVTKLKKKKDREIKWNHQAPNNAQCSVHAICCFGSTPL